jgi:hypothetical protein
MVKSLKTPSPAGRKIRSRGDGPFGLQPFDPNIVLIYANPALSIPCYGECRPGHAQDDELVLALIFVGCLRKSL